MLLDSNLFSNNDFTVFISANNCKSYKWRSVYNLSAVAVAETPTILLPPPRARIPLLRMCTMAGGRVARVGSRHVMIGAHVACAPMVT